MKAPITSDFLDSKIKNRSVLSTIWMAWTRFIDDFISATAKQNLIINGGCRVASPYGNVACVLTTRTYGGADQIAVTLASFTSVTAGNIVQATGLSWTSTGYAQKIAGLSTTGSGSLSFDCRMEAKKTSQKNGKTVIFSATIMHDVGSAVTARAYIHKADSTDNFSSRTLLAAGVEVSVSSGVQTTVSVSVKLGNSDASTGLEGRVVFSSVGAITTKNFWFGEAQFTDGDYITPILIPDLSVDMANCAAQCQKFNVVKRFNAAAGEIRNDPFPYPVEFRATPTLTLLTTGTRNNIASANFVGLSPNVGYFGVVATASGDTYVINDIWIGDALL